MYERIGWIWNEQKESFDLLYQHEKTGAIWIFTEHEARWGQPEFTSVSAV